MVKWIWYVRNRGEDKGTVRISFRVRAIGTDTLICLLEAELENYTKLDVYTDCL